MYPDRQVIDCAAMSDDEGVLANLPRSRPGRRSDKRAGGAAKAAAPGPNPAAADKPKPAAAAKPKPAAAKPKPPPAPPRPAAEPAPGGNPIGTAIRTVTGLAAGGARAANGLARGVFRRLPKP